MIKIYGGPTFNVTKVLLAAEEAGLDYEYIGLNLPGGEHKTPEHIKRHSLGKIPAIEHDGKPLFESAVICRYLVQLSENNLLPKALYQRAVVEQWIDMMTCHTGRWLGALYFHEYITPLFFEKEGNQETIAEAKEFLEQQLPIVDAQLAETGFLAGDHLTIADLFAFCYFQTHEQTSVDLSEFKNITAWYNKIKQRPSVAKVNALMQG